MIIIIIVLLMHGKFKESSVDILISTGHSLSKFERKRVHIIALRDVDDEE